MPRSTRARRHQARISSDNSSDSESSKDIDYGSSSDSQYDDDLLLSSDENQATDLPSDTFTIDDFMLVQFEGTLCYVAKIVEEVEVGEDLIVSDLRKKPKYSSAFCFPEVPDVHAVSVNDVICKLPSPYNSKTARLARHVRFPFDFSGRNMR